MTTTIKASYFHKQAETLLRLAAVTSDQAVAARLRQVAADVIDKANELEILPPPPGVAD